MWFFVEFQNTLDDSPNIDLVEIRVVDGLINKLLVFLFGDAQILKVFLLELLTFSPLLIIALYLQKKRT